MCNIKINIVKIDNIHLKKIQILPVFSSDYYIDAPPGFYNISKPMNSIIYKNSLVILPFKIIVKNENLVVKIITENYKKNEY